MTYLSPRTRLVGVVALALAASTLGACVTWGEAAQAPGTSLPQLEATFVNRHRHALEAVVSMKGREWRLGIVEPGQQRTFRLPRRVTEGDRYYLVGDCAHGERIASEAVVASPEDRPRFIAGRDSIGSYVLFPSPPALTTARR